MPKEKRKKKQKAYLFPSTVHYVIISLALLSVSILLILLGKKPFQKVQADTAGYYVPIIPTPGTSSDHTLHFGAIQFQFIAYTPTPTPPSSSDGSTETGCASTQERNSLSSKGFIVQGPGRNSASVYTQTTDSLCILAADTKFMSLLKIQNDGPVYINLNITGPSCSGFSSGGYFGIYVNIWCEPDRNRLMVGHELGHTIEARSPSVYQAFLQNVYRNGLNTMPTWNCLVHSYGASSTSSGGPFPYECFSDMVGEYLVYNSFREVVGGQPNTDQFGHPLGLGNAFPEFPTQWNSYFSFVKTNIY